MDWQEVEYGDLKIKTIQTQRGLFFQLASLLPAWGYKSRYFPRVLDKDGKNVNLLSKINLTHKIMYKTFTCLSVKGVLALLKLVLDGKYSHSRNEKEAFLNWFKAKYASKEVNAQQPTEQTTIPLTEIHAATPEELSEIFPGDRDELINEIHRLEAQVDKLMSEVEDMHSRLHDANVEYEQLQADAEEAHEEIENLRDELAKAHATIDKLSNALVDRL